MKDTFVVEPSGSVSFSQMGGDHITVFGTVVDGLKPGIGRRAEIKIHYPQLVRMIKWAAEHCEGTQFNRDYQNALLGAEWIEGIARQLREDAEAMPEWKKPRDYKDGA